jgi:hypothetical protein
VLEACGSAHYWARQLQPLGHVVRLLPPMMCGPKHTELRTEPSPIRPPVRRIWASLPLASSPQVRTPLTALRFACSGASASRRRNRVVRGGSQPRLGDLRCDRAWSDSRLCAVARWSLAARNNCRPTSAAHCCKARVRVLA